MHFSALVVAALAAVASAGPAMKRQAECPEVGNIPACGYPCIQSAAAELGCGETDYACMCGQFDALRSAAAVCVLQNCGLAEAPAVLEAAEAVCNACA